MINDKRRYFWARCNPQIIIAAVACLLFCRGDNAISGTKSPHSAAVATCKINYAAFPIAGTLLDESGHQFSYLKQISLSPAISPDTGSKGVLFEEDVTLFFISPIMQQYASTLQDQIVAAGQAAQGCQNSFIRASAYAIDLIPPQIEGQATARKRTCTTVLGYTVINEVASGTEFADWQLNVSLVKDGASAPKDGDGIQITSQQTRHSYSQTDTTIIDLFKDLSIDAVIISHASNYFDSQLVAVGHAISQIPSVSQPIPSVGAPNAPVYNDPEWIRNSDPKLQPYALHFKRSYALYELPACEVVRCLRDYGDDLTNRGECPYLSDAPGSPTPPAPSPD